LDSFAPGADIGLFHKLLDLMPQLVWTARPDGYRDYYNKVFYDYTGKTFDQVKGFGWESIHEPTLLPAVKEHWKESLETGKPFETEYHLLGKDGNYRWFLARINPIYDDKGQLIGWVGTNTDIEEKKQTQMALAEQNLQLQTLAEAIPQMVWSGNAQGWIDYFNSRWYTYTGLTEEESIGWAWRQALHPDDVEVCLQKWNLALSTGAPYEIEYRFKRASDNVFRWHLGRATSIKDAQGKPLHWFGTCTDIHDQKELEQALEARVRERTSEQKNLILRSKESEDKFRAIFDQTFQLVGLVNTDGILIEANQTALDFIGADREDIVGKMFWTTPYWSHSKALQTQLKKAIADAAAGNFVRFEAEHFGINGRRDIDFSIKPVQVADDTVMLIAEGRDITESKQAAKEIREQAALLDLTHDTVIVRTMDGIIKFWNRGASAMYGYSREEIIGKVSHEILKTKFPKQLDQIETELIKNGRWEGELIHTTKDNRLIVVDSRWALEKDQEEQQQVLEINNDITIRKMAESKMLQLAAELARSNEDLEQFAYAASHDMQEPLRTVISFCDLLTKKTHGKLDPDSEKYLAVIVESTARMQHMIKDLLLYARLDAQGKTPAAIDSQEALSLAISGLQKAIAESGAEIIHDKLPVVMADLTQLSLLFQNLLSNAIKFRGEEPLKIKIDAVRQGPFWQFSVFDNGIGMNMAYADRIFVIFQRLHSRSKYQGTGIGLALCKRIVERHGGSIKVSSIPNKGSVFIFTLLPPDGD